MLSRRRYSRHRALKLLLWAIISAVVLLAVLVLLNPSGLFLKQEIRGTTFNLETGAHANEGARTSSIENRSISFTNGERFSLKDQASFTSTQIQCRFDTCIDFSLCQSGFYVYAAQPNPSDIKERIRSPIYLKILMSIRQSVFFTSDPSRACIFVHTTDTIDRDIQSRDFIPHLDRKISRRDRWNRHGKNFLIFNLFSGTWPSYLENLAFDYGYAMVARASFSEEKMRRGYDISFPLFQKDHPQIARVDSYNAAVFPLKRKYLVAFKGKRYLFGIGSEVRDELHILHNNRDIILLTTCKHGKEWMKFADSRCDSDIERFERYDYQELLYNSTFCLVPRGRRLGSFRFLESLQAGCIPVVMSDGWNLPFSSVIDWSRAVLHISEKALLQVPIILRSISRLQILSMKQQGIFLYYTYFSSIHQIISTTLKIIHDRVAPHKEHSYHMWNHPPGALDVHTSFSTQMPDFPFYYGILGIKPGTHFTAVIMAVTPARQKSGKLFKLIETINLSEYVDQILVVWLAPARIPDKSSWPQTSVSLRVIYPKKKTLSTRFLDGNLVKADAVFTFNEDVVITKSEIDFAFHQWRAFPDQLVGFTLRDHYWDPILNSWMFTSRISNSYSMVMLNAAVFHRYYNHLYTTYLPNEVYSVLAQYMNCEDIALNFLISKVTNKPPVKVAHSRHFNPGDVDKEVGGRKASDSAKRRLERFRQKQRCFQELIRIFGRVTLKRSQYKLDPLLFRDPISNFRKRYRDLEP